VKGTGATFDAMEGIAMTNLPSTTPSPSTPVDAPGMWISADQAAEFATLRQRERRRQRTRQLRKDSPTDTGRRVVSMLRSVLPKLADHVALGSVAPGDLRDLRTALDDAVNVAIVQLRDQGYSWPEVGRELGVTQQAAHQRWQRYMKRTGA